MTEHDERRRCQACGSLLTALAANHHHATPPPADPVQGVELPDKPADAELERLREIAENNYSKWQEWRIKCGDAENARQQIGQQLAESRAKLAAAEARVVKLQAFKDWVHAYLDNHGVPHHPPGTHGAAGCRIGDRMDWLMERVAKLEGALQEMADTALREVRYGHKSAWQWVRDKARAALAPQPKE